MAKKRSSGRVRTRRIYMRSRRGHRKHDSYNVLQDAFLAGAIIKPAIAPYNGDVDWATAWNNLKESNYNPFHNGGPAWYFNQSPVEEYVNSAKANWKTELLLLGGAYVSNLVGRTSFGRKLSIKWGSKRIKLF